MNKKARLTGILSLTVAFGIVTGCSGNAEEAATAEQTVREMPVEAATVSYGSLSDSNEITGTIIPEQEVTVMPKAAGELVNVMVEKGDIVKTGDILAKIDDTNERNTLQQQQASLRQAQSSLQNAQNAKVKAEKSYEQAQASLRQAEASLEDARKSQQDNLDNLEFDIDNAKTAWDQAKQNLERMKLLYEDGLISKKDYEDAVDAEKNAKNAYDKVKLNKEQASSEVALKSLEASVEKAEIGVSLAESSIRDAEIGVTQAQASVDQAQLAVEAARDRLEDKVITAPAAGEITSLSGQEGEMASSQSEFATIVAIDTVKVSVNVMPEQLSLFKKGEQVDVKVTGVDQDFTGTISYVAATSSGSGLFTVEADVDNTDRLIRPGMVASFVFDEVLVDDTLLVPSDAILQDQGKSVVFVVEDGKAVQKEVEVVRYGTDATAVTGDLAEDDQVVTNGKNLLEDGDSVKIMEED